MSKDQERIIERVKKLLRLADVKRGGTPAEVASAAAKAQALLLEHNLVAEDVGDLESGERAEKIGVQAFNLEATYLTGRWHASLMHVIARPLFCRMLYYPAKASRPGRVSLVGKPSNVAIARYFYSYLHRVIDLMAVEYREGWKARKDKRGGAYIPDESFRVRIDFCLGAVRVIGERLAAEYAKRTDKNENCRALVVVSDKALDAAFKEHFPKTGKTSSKRQKNFEAELAGAVAGARIPLSRGVGGRDAAKQLSA